MRCDIALLGAPRLGDYPKCFTAGTKNAHSSENGTIVMTVSFPSLSPFYYFFPIEGELRNIILQ